MEKNDRRTFLAQLGLTVGALTVGRGLVRGLPLQTGEPQAAAPPPPSEIDFRYSPANWQSTYCFPDDPSKSLVDKNGQLLYGHPGLSADWDEIPHIVSFGLQGMGPGAYVVQKLQSPGIPIITTELAWATATMRLTTFATNDPEEGRIDNVAIELTPKGVEEVELTPEITIKSKERFSATSSDDRSTLHFLSSLSAVFMAVSSSIAAGEDEAGNHTLVLKRGTAKKDRPLRLLVRFPQEQQTEEKIKYNVDDAEKLTKEALDFWLQWKPTAGKVSWQLGGTYQDFAVACSRNIVQSREVKNGKKLFQVGPTCYRGLWMVDGYSLLEAARYLGYDKEAQEGLESIWDRQAPSGAITGGAGESHYKDSAVAVYTLIRQAELSQNWDYFNELYPDAFKAIDYLRQLRDKAREDGSPSGAYGILPKGFGDSGIGGVRSELTNTLWSVVALKKLLEVAKRLKLERLSAINAFYGELRQAFYRAANEEMRKHPKGFTYLPMLMKDDPKWAEADERKQPRPQAAQIYLTQAIYPGLAFIRGDRIVNGNIELLKAVTTKEDIPIETGWLTDNAVWPYNAAITAQMYLWAGLPELARKTFIGFLNHASPLYAWREEQSLLDAPKVQYIGDMPHNWASAECLRYFRHMLILEDERNLRLFDGVGLPEMQARAPMALTASPTKWGRVTVTLEPVDKKIWRTKFVREEFDEKTMPPIGDIELPRKLPGGFWFDTITGATRAKNGERVLVPSSFLTWECTWRSL